MLPSPLVLPRSRPLTSSPPLTRRRARGTLCVVALVAALSLPRTSRAADAPPPAPESAEAKRIAKAHFDIAVHLYQSEKYADAAREFQQAYDLSHLPDVLFNLGRTEAKLGHEEAAIGYLRRWLAEKQDVQETEAADVRSEIAALERVRDEKRHNEELHAQLKRRDEELARQHAVLPRWPSYALLGGGAALLAGGIVAGAIASSDSSAVHGSAKGTVWSSDLQNRDARGAQASVASIALDVVGGVALAAGAGLLVYTLRAERHASAERRASSVRVLPTPGGLVAAGSF